MLAVDSLASMWQDVAPCWPYLLASAVLLFAVRLWCRKMYVYKDLTHFDVSCAEPSAGRDVGALPPVFPNGWFRIMMSEDLQPGQVAFRQYLGRKLAVFRTESGKAHILDAYCPHLGANLGVGGKVVGECLRCPFHDWEFQGDGKCTKIPYSDAKIMPESTSAKSYICEEYNDMICMWYHAEGVEPFWTPVLFPELHNHEAVFHGYAQHKLACHIQEMPENGADVAHLNTLHSSFIYRLLDKLGFKHYWTASWEKGNEEEDKHLTYMTVTEDMTFLGYKIPGTHFDVKINQIGPGFVVLCFDTLFGKVTVSQSVTPAGPLEQVAIHAVYAARTVPRPVAKFILDGLIRQFERDIPIWNNKTYQKQPALVKGDGPIAEFRRWFSQFYTENSPTFHSVMKKSLDW